ncbi:protein PIP82 isoform X3 [Drosophila albomicans]|uniref:Protein PIP82 isoform X3 n=1 Tax=Drosophila albomicans TaxID=7291 RepID=A0A9C6T4J5_DROAB|nr:protein PIP82 isoform X3 [Drosophila albomicans]
MSHHLSQESSQQPHQPERGRHGGGGGGGGIMDLRNFCQRIDVDSLKAKLPAMPQLKLPKTLPKLRGARRIFRSSRDNVSGGGGNKAASHEGAAVGAGGGGVSIGQLALPQQQQAAQFINRTPQRISTISSLMHEQTSTEQQQHHHHHLQPSGATYCSAGSLDDDYYAPYGGSMTARVSRPISPIKMPPTGNEQQQQQQQERGTLTQRLQRGYKSLSELRLKHLFAKQTVVRRDNIEVQRYVEQYEAERRVEQMAQARRDRDIADNYDIHISTLPITRQNTLKQQQDGEEEAEEDAVQQVRRMADHSGDESGLETPPPPPPPAVARKKKPGGIAATRFAKVRQPPLQMPVEEGAMDQQQQSQEKQPMRQAVRQKLKRLRKSMKRRQASQQQQQDSDDEEEEQEKQQQQRGSTASNLRARLRRFASSEQLQQRWRKSFKGGDEEGTDTGAGIGGAGKGGAGKGGAGKGGAGLGGANKGGAGLGGVGLGGAAAAGSGLGVAAQLERSLARLNEKLQQLKFFQRKSQQPQGNKPNTVGREPIEIDDEELPATYHHSDSDSEHGSNDSDDSGQDICAEDAFGQLDIADAPRSASPMLVKHQTLATLAQLQAHASTAWSSESLEEDIALDGQQQQQRDEMACTAADYPRVLIHQQHSDAYESTLIIAVTTTPPTPSPPHSQQHQQQPWLPNEQIIAGFKEQQQRDCWPAPMLYKPKSIDIFESGDGGAASAFADFDEALRNAPVLRISAGSSYDSNTEDADDNSSRVTRIRVQTPRIGNSRESLMEQQTLEQEEEQEEAEEALEELEEGQEQPEEQLEMERAEEESERPPSMSPPPPPLPQRRPPPPTSAAPIYDAVPPPLPISKPPTTLPTATAPPPLTAATTPTVATAAPTTSPVAAAPQTPASPVAAAPSLQRQPLRSASMTRPAKPLVKTSSLRLTYNEQMHPNDVGKVNKLISRFGGRSRLGARRLHSEELTICSDGDDESEELPEEPATPTPSNVKRSNSSNNNNNIIPDIVTTAASNNNNNNNETMQLDRQNSNCSRSEYGSPLAYPQLNATPTATTTTTATSARAGRPRAPQPQPQLQLQSQSQLQLQRRSRRSMTRDDDNFYSFDSDEENSYYSISPSSSSRYVVEI